jgi:hypothetical protein
MRNPYKKPRTAYCTGCGVIFDHMTAMRNHRRSQRCGGRFLSQGEKDNLLALRRIREEHQRIQRVLAK